LLLTGKILLEFDFNLSLLYCRSEKVLVLKWKEDASENKSTSKSMFKPDFCAYIR